MIETLMASSRDVFINSVGLDVQKCDDDLDAGYISTIGFECGNIKALTFIFEKEFLEEVGELMMIGSDEEAITDLSCELANLIAGHAKVIIKDKNGSCEITTPTFGGVKKVDSGNSKVSFLCSEKRFTIVLGSISNQTKGD